MITRSILQGEDHRLIRETARAYCEREIAPRHAEWEKQGFVPPGAWRRVGELGLLCMTMPVEYGGSGLDFGASAILIEELARVGATGPGFALHSDIVAQYLLHHASDALKATWLPQMATGRKIAAIAMTEPGTGSDLQAVRTRAVRSGDDYVLNGSKTFITNGQTADFVVVVARTGEEGGKGVSLLLVEADRSGFRRGRNLEKIGMKAQDTSELFFDDVRIPTGNLIGDENQGFAYLMMGLPQERLIIALTAVAAAEAALEETVRYARERTAFGKSILDFQNTRFVLARAKAEIAACRAFVDHCLAAHIDGRLDVATAAAAKLIATEMQNRVLDQFLQLHGGYGYMWEYSIARAWADARAQRIYGGANEIMLELIARTL
ncbi:MAG TPA: acyl-CoA dehydrogenase family protein [Caulobacteraceae bacterium]|jgi:acyl-CoA dehydrogenase|nr:acyl-CoA dehydrogenase family protein [Caulobacteraceae bacterium]